MEKSTKSAAAPKVKYLSVELPDAGFPVVTFVNRFGLEQLEGSLIVHFGLITKSGEVKSSYSMAMTELFIKNSREDWVDYVGKVGDPPEVSADLTWRPPLSRTDRVDFVNAMRVGRTGPDSEIRCYCVSMISAIDAQLGATAPSKGLAAIPLALLQMPLEQQQLLLFELVKRPIA